EKTASTGQQIACDFRFGCQECGDRDKGCGFGAGSFGDGIGSFVVQRPTLYGIEDRIRASEHCAGVPKAIKCCGESVEIWHAVGKGCSIDTAARSQQTALLGGMHRRRKTTWCQSGQ